MKEITDAMTNEVVTCEASGGEVTAKRSLWERGMTTVEYAVGILAAIAVALVLLRIFSDNAFFQVLYDFIVKALKNVIP